MAVFSGVTYQCPAEGKLQDGYNVWYTVNPSIRVSASSNRRFLVIAEDVTCWKCVTLSSKRPQKLRGFAVRWRHAEPLLAVTLGAPGCGMDHVPQLLCNKTQ